MAITNPDGTPYRLRGPNPLVAGTWGDVATCHNFVFPEFTTHAGYSDINDISVEEIKVPIRNTAVDPQYMSRLLKRKEKLGRLGDLPKTLLHCLPMETRRDELYGEEREVYGTQFTFEAVVISMTDVLIQAWTNGVGVPVSSVVFTPSNRRWWKITTSEPRAEGVLVTGIPSDFQPSFS